METARQHCASVEENGNGLRPLSFFSLAIIRRVTSRSMLSASSTASSKVNGVWMDV